MYRVADPHHGELLPFDQSHHAVWSCLTGQDRAGLRDALREIARRVDAPLVQAAVGSALQALGETDFAPLDPAVAARAARGGDPFVILGPDAARLQDGRPVALHALVHAIVSAADPGRLARDLERTFAAARGAVDAAPAPGYRAVTVIANLFFAPRFLNVGGGSRFIHPFWLNVDDVAPAGGGLRRRLTADLELPLPDRSVEIAYSSHCLEHLDDETARRVLQEMYRVLQPGGRLVLKLPDAEHAIGQWRAGRGDFFADPVWGLDSVAWTWAAHGLADTLDNRFVYLLCGYWNAAMEAATDRGNAVASGAFNGPPAVDPQDLRRMADTAGPHDLARWLAEQARAEDPAARFNHQNAWSAAELDAWLRHAGFDGVAQQADAVVARNQSIPDIEKYRSISHYAEAVRPAFDATADAPQAGAGTQTGAGAQATQMVAPAAAGLAEAAIPVANYAAWEPKGVGSLEARPFLRGLIRLTGILWDYHAEVVRAAHPAEQPTSFLSFGYARGIVPTALLSTIEGIFRQPDFRFEMADFRADGLPTRHQPPTVRSLQENLRFYAPDPAQRAAVVAFLQSIEDRVRTELQSPWRVLTIRCYETEVSFQSGPQAWHSDGFPRSIHKILIYLAGDREPVRGSELIDLQGRRVRIEGESGTWLLFDPTRLTHRAPSIGSERRRIVEVVLCADLSTDIAFRFGGTNFRHPVCPPGIDPFDVPAATRASPLAQTMLTLARELSTDGAG